ncbi:MAG: hypothetical protein HZR80_03435 [Candidatus Heimdallarchaeota archaeon]
MTKSKGILKGKRKGQIFLVCTVIMIIYMLSFVNIIYELNKTQYTKAIDTQEFQAAYENFKTETNNFVIAMLANYSLITTVIDSNATAGTILQNWLDFAEMQMISKGYVAVFEIDEIVPVILPILLANVNGRLTFIGDVDVYMESNYMTIDTQFSFNLNYTISYVNTAINAIIEFSSQSLLGISYIGYAQVTINGLPTTNLNNGTYIYSAPLAPGDIIQGVTAEQIIVIRTA